MNLTIHEIINVTKNQKLMDSYSDSVGIASAIIDLEGTVVIGSRWKRICTDFHRVNEYSCQRCIHSDTTLAAMMQGGKRYSLYRCQNGLTDAASPIMVEGRHLANAFVGQFLLEPPDINFFKAQAKEFGYDESAYLQALSEVPVMDERKVPVVLEFLVSYAELLADMILTGKKQIESEQMLNRTAKEILELSVPVIQVWDGIVATPLIGTLDSHRTGLLMDRLLQEIARTQSPVALLDITGVPLIDTQTAQHLIETITAVQLMGTEIVVTGISPAIAQTLVHLGIDMSRFETCASLSAGIAKAMHYLNLQVLPAVRNAPDLTVKDR